MTSAQLAKLALDQLSQILGKLTEDQLQDLAAGRGYFEFHTEEIIIKATKLRKAAASVGIDVEAVAKEIEAIGTSAGVTSYLDGRSFKLTELKAIAVALGPTVSSKGRTLADMKYNIVEGVAGFRERSAAIGGWQR
ncbi:MAG TPA: hypothetical protein VF062_02365 [Candidatus Limnocylindrales bacterium]